MFLQDNKIFNINPQAIGTSANSLCLPVVEVGLVQGWQSQYQGLSYVITKTGLLFVPLVTLKTLITPLRMRLWCPSHPKGTGQTLKSIFYLHKPHVIADLGYQIPTVTEGSHDLDLDDKKETGDVMIW